MKKKRAKVLFTYINQKEMQSFTKQDYDILREDYYVNPYFFTGKVHAHLDRIGIILALLKTDISFSDFAYTNAYFAVKYGNMLGKKSIVKVAGFDVAEEEVFDKQFNPKLVSRLKYTLNNADKVITCSEALKQKAQRFMNNGQVEVIPYGFDHEHFKQRGNKRNIAITAGFVRRDYLWRNGLETFVKAAKYLPDTRFIVIGEWVDDSIEHLRSLASPNVEFTGYVSNEMLLRLMQEAKVYVQVSYHEGFGFSLAEAMLCQCVPVVTDRGAIPEVVGEAGIYVPYNDPEATALAIKEALENRTLGEKARERIKELFPVEKRRRRLKEVVEECL